MAAGGNTSLTGMKIPGNKTTYYTTTATWQTLANGMQSVMSDTAAYLKMNLPKVIVSRSQGTTDTGEAARQARSIARDWTIAAQLMKLAARFAVRARHKYDRYVDEAPARASARPQGTFDADS